MAKFKYYKLHKLKYMEKLKIDTKDRRILDILDKTPNASLSEIAKKVGTSKQVVEYRISKLIQQKTIYSFFTIVNLGKLGYSLFRAHIKLKNVSEEEYDEFAKTLFQKYPTFWVAFVSGSFDIIVDIWAKSIVEFSELFGNILHKNKRIIYSYEYFPMLSLDIYSYGYFLDDIRERRKTPIFLQSLPQKIDKTDIKILDFIKSNSRSTYEEVGRKVGLTRNAVKNRIINLEKREVISGRHIMVNFKHFNRMSYKIFVAYDYSKINEEQELLNYLKQIPGILAHAKLLGKWDLDIELQPHNAKELQQFLIQLRNKFKIIRDYELIQILDDYGLNFLPRNLFR